MNEAAVLKLIQKRIEGSTARKVATELGISAAFLSDIMKGKRGLGEKVPTALGLERVVTYRRNGRTV